MNPQEEITGMLQRAMGFDAAALSPFTVSRAVKRRSLQCGQRDDHSYLVFLRASALEMSQLVEELVVPETWFFRDGSPFEWLARHVMEAWRPANPLRPLRVLSVPCSSGEEPYSIVMCLIEAGLLPEHISVDAVDISQVALGKARRGLYGRNSFRSMPAGMQERYFDTTPRGWLLREAVKTPVRFIQANLLQGGFGIGHAGYDIIFCRNLLIYFDDPNRELALSLLERLLLPQGILFVGHAESAPLLNQWFASVGVPQTFAYRKKSTQASMPPPPAARPRATIISRRTAPFPLKPVPRAVEIVALPTAAPEEALLKARRLADEGRLAEAAVVCEALLRDDGPSASAYYLLGLVHDACGDADNAREFFGKTVYLEPDHCDALVNLALLAERQGRTDEARLLRQRVERAARRKGERA